MKCEDYPCCGHTPYDPCDWSPPSGEHANCDHENGVCEVADYFDNDDEPEDEPDEEMNYADQQ